LTEKGKIKNKAYWSGLGTGERSFGDRARKQKRNIGKRRGKRGCGTLRVVSKDEKRRGVKQKGREK